jgi:hypothetical protein
MDASKLKNGNGNVAAKNSRPAAVRTEAKKVVKRATGKKAKTERERPKGIGSSKSDKLVCHYCGSDDLAPSFIKGRDRRCRKCFSKHGSAVRNRKTKVKK